MPGAHADAPKGIHYLQFKFGYLHQYPVPAQYTKLNAHREVSSFGPKVSLNSSPFCSPPAIFQGILARLGASVFKDSVGLVKNKTVRRPDTTHHEHNEDG